MQHSVRPGAARSARSVLLAAWASAASFACSSDHRLGDLSPVDLGENPDAVDGSTAGEQDFRAPAELGPPHLSIEEANPELPFSSYVVSIGDIDGDGFGDLATRSVVSPALEHVHIRYGGPRPQNAADSYLFAEGGVRLVADQENLSIQSISSVGDVDGDGFADVLVGLLACNAAPRAYLFYGGAERLQGVARMADVGVLFEGPPPVVSTSALCAGISADWRKNTAGLGDHDGDGFDDFMLSAPQTARSDDPEIVPRGNLAYLFYGRAARFASGTPWQRADARLSAPRELNLVPTGDINADGLSDLILGTEYDGEPGTPRQAQQRLPAGYFWLPGQAEPLSGDIDLADVATAALPRIEAAGDLDGDGVRDVIAYDDADAPHLFYGTAGLFDAGADFAAADATFEPYTGEPHANLFPVLDWDGDGDDELVSSHFLAERFFGMVPQQFAVLSGISSRRMGEIRLSEPSAPWPEGYVLFEGVFAAGDLDGDGAGDIITRSGHYVSPEEKNYDAPSRSVIVGGHALIRSSFARAEINIHYGTPGESPAPPR